MTVHKKLLDQAFVNQRMFKDSKHFGRAFSKSVKRLVKKLSNEMKTIYKCKHLYALGISNFLSLSCALFNKNKTELEPSKEFFTSGAVTLK